MTLLKASKVRVVFLYALLIGLGNFLVLSLDAQEPVVVMPDLGGQEFVKKTDEPSEILSDGLSLEEIQKMLVALLNEHFEAAARKRQDMLNLVAEIPVTTQMSIDSIITQATVDYSRLVERLNIGTMLKEQVAELLVLLAKEQGAIASQESIDAVFPLLEKLYAALLCGSFTGILKGPSIQPEMNNLIMLNPVGIQTLFSGNSLNNYEEKKYGMVEYSLTDLHALTKGLSELVVVPLQDAMIVVDKIEILKRFLHAIEAKNPNEITLVALEYIQPFYEAVAQQMKIVIEVLADCKDRTDIQEKNKQAAAFWLRELEKQASTMLVLKSLHNNANLNPSYDFHNFFKMAASAYDMSMLFVNIYKQDHLHLGAVEYYFGRAALFDYSLRTALAGWFYVNSSADLNTSLLFKTISGDMKLQGLKASHLYMYNMMILPFMAPILVGYPNLLYRSTSKLEQSAYKVVAAYAYYQVFYSYLFKRNAHLHTNFTNQAQLAGYCLAKGINIGNDALDAILQQSNFSAPDAVGLIDQVVFDHGNVISLDAVNSTIAKLSWWPRDYPHLIKGLIDFSYQATDVFGKIIEMQVRDTVDPRTLQAVEKYTMHLIRPEVVTVVLKACLPMFFLAPGSLAQSIGDFKAEYLIDRNIIALAQEHKADPVLCNIEMFILCHISASFGMHWGSYFAGKYKKSIMRAVGSSIDCSMSFFNGIGFISDESIVMYEAAKLEIAEEFAQYATMFKSIIKGFFQPHSSARAMALPFLIEHGYLDKNETDQLRINQSLICMIFSTLGQYRFVSYVKLSELIALYEKNPHNLDGIIDLVIDEIGGNLVALACGRVASGVATGLTYGAYTGTIPFVGKSMQVGPIYPKFFGKDSAAA